jgi:hypothetical protein
MSIVCYDGSNVVNGVDQGKLLYNADATPPKTDIGPFRVKVPDGTAATECVLLNRFLKTSPSATSTQLAKIFDYLVVDAIQPGASNASSARITVYLFPSSDANCSGAASSSTGALSLTYLDSGSPGLKKALVNTLDSALASAAANGFGSPGGSWKWAFSYTGDALNNAMTVAQTCGWETGSVTFSESPKP